MIASPRENARQFICDRCVGRSLNILKQAKEEELREAPGIAGGLKRKFSGRPARLHFLR